MYLLLMMRKYEAGWQARNLDFMWGGGGANGAKVAQTTERDFDFLLPDLFI